MKPSCATIENPKNVQHQTTRRSQCPEEQYTQQEQQPIPQPMERLVAIGLSHETAPVELREKLTQWPLHDLRSAAIAELVILSTCNRLEIYAYLADSHTLSATTTPAQPLIDLIATTQNLSPSTFVDHLYHFQGEAACRHLCRVAAGLESLVLGEGQILGQVRAALQHGYAVKSVGPTLALLFRTAINAGKRARSETHISTNPVSVSSAALALATQVTTDLRSQEIAVIGLGEIGQLLLKGLQARGAGQLHLVNRTRAKAEQLAALYNGQAYGMEEVTSVLCKAAVVFTATTAVEPLFDESTLQAILATRKSQPLTLIDLAVPRNIDPTATRVPGVQLYDIDDLRTVVDSSLAARQAEKPRVEAIIAEALAQWHQQSRELHLRPVVVGLRQKAEQTRRRLVERALAHLERQQGEVDEQTAEQLWHLSRALVNQLLHVPTVKLKQSAGRPEEAAYAAFICDLFDLDIPLSTDAEATNTSAMFDLQWLVETDAELATAAAEEQEGALGAAVADQVLTDQWVETYELVGQP
ncbi:MAG: glutamyl-tRNA reductase [Caldilineaceae bacterium]